MKTRFLFVALILGCLSACKTAPPREEPTPTSTGDPVSRQINETFDFSGKPNLESAGWSVEELEETSTPAPDHGGVRLPAKGGGRLRYLTRLEAPLSLQVRVYVPATTKFNRFYLFVERYDKEPTWKAEVHLGQQIDWFRENHGTTHQTRQSEIDPTQIRLEETNLIEMRIEDQKLIAALNGVDQTTWTGTPGVENERVRGERLSVGIVWDGVPFVLQSIRVRGVRSASPLKPE